MIRHQPASTALIGPNGSRLPDFLRGVQPGYWPGADFSLYIAASHSVALLGE